MNSVIPRMCVVALSCVFGMLPASWAHAQPGGEVRVIGIGPGVGIGEGMISRRSVSRYGDLLGLDDEQRKVLEVLYEGYAVAYQDARAAMTEGLQELSTRFRETQDLAAFREEMPEILEAFRDRTSSLEEGFFRDLDAILRDEQRERMDRVERMRRRETGLRSSVSGAGVDLIDIVDGLQITENADLEQALFEYEMALDRVLREGERATNHLRRRHIDSDAVSREFRRLREFGLKLRDLNDRHARIIGDLLGVDDRERFMRQVRERGYPQVYRRPYVRRVIDAARGFEDLSEEQRARLGTILEEYEREAERLNEAWVREIRASDEQDGANTFVTLGGGRVSFAGGGDSDTPLARAMRARRDLDRRIEEEVLALLGDRLSERLPRRTAEDREQFTVGEVFKIEGD